MNWILAGVLVVVNTPLFVFYGRTFFGGMDDFLNAIRLSLQPDLWSALKGEFWEDQYETLKLSLLVAACVLTVVGEYGLVMKIFGQPG